MIAIPLILVCLYHAGFVSVDWRKSTTLYVILWWGKGELVHVICFLCSFPCSPAAQSSTLRPVSLHPAPLPPWQLLLDPSCFPAYCSSHFSRLSFVFLPFNIEYHSIILSICVFCLLPEPRLCSRPWGWKICRHERPFKALLQV